jgi:predicted  nucleic acid-binding Zn-ribbon protein
MNIQAETLRTLHRLHRQLSDVRDRLVRGPKQIAAAQAAVAHCEEQLKEAKDAHLKARVNADRKQLQLREREARVADLKVKLNQASSNREYQALKEQIAADEQANRVLEDEILEALEQIDLLAGKVREAQELLTRSKAELEKTLRRVEEEKAICEAELARLTQELHQTEALLPADFRAEYQRVVNARGENALAPLNNRYCGHCNCALTSQAVQQVLMEKPVFCRSCGALLYLPER